MPSAPPPGLVVPSHGRLPAEALASVGTESLSIYVHVPFCASRCGYCDFNTYTAGELDGSSSGDYLGAALAEVDLAREVLGNAAPPVSTVFFGGGTPTVLPSSALARLLDRIDHRFGLTGDAEITTEANPESVTAGSLAELVAAGFTRISFGMQSADTGVLRVLDRQHTPGRALAAAAQARAAGFDQLSLDLIYGTPGETLDQWRASLTAALSVGPDHLSAYSLIVEDGTRLAARIRRGELRDVDEDYLADAYLLADDLLAGHGLHGYEVSNWSSAERTRCRHNLAYWKSAHWWGIGPGAHSHVGGTRWWNVRHPRRYAERLAAGESPGEGREILDAETRRVERIMLQIRLADGLDLRLLTDDERARLATPLERGWARERGNRLTLTVAGRLMPDGIVRDLLA